MGRKRSVGIIIVNVLLFSCILSSQALAQTEDFYTEGYIAADDTVLYVKDSIAIWRKEGKELIIDFYPFKLTEEDVNLFLENIKGDFTINLSYNKPSPDDAKWQWCPNGSMWIKFDDSSKDKTLKNITSVNYAFYGLTKKNYTMNALLREQEARDALDIYVITKEKNQDMLEISTRGEYEHSPSSFDSTAKYSWNLKTRTKIFTSKTEEQLLQLTIKTDKEVYELAEPIRLSMFIKNISDNDVDIPLHFINEKNKLLYYVRLGILVTDIKGNPLKFLGNHAKASSFLRTLKPEETIEAFEINLLDWFNMGRADTYKVQVLFTTISSNTITIEVVEKKETIKGLKQ